MPDVLDDVHTSLLRGEEHIRREATWFYRDFAGNDSGVYYRILIILCYRLLGSRQCHWSCIGLDHWQRLRQTCDFARFGHNIASFIVAFVHFTQFGESFHYLASGSDPRRRLQYNWTSCRRWWDCTTFSGSLADGPGAVYMGWGLFVQRVCDVHLPLGSELADDECTDFLMLGLSLYFLVKRMTKFGS